MRRRAAPKTAAGGNAWVFLGFKYPRSAAEYTRIRFRALALMGTILHTQYWEAKCSATEGQVPAHLVGTCSRNLLHHSRDRLRCSPTRDVLLRRAWATLERSWHEATGDTPM